MDKKLYASAAARSIAATGPTGFHPNSVRLAWDRGQLQCYRDEHGQRFSLARDVRRFAEQRRDRKGLIRAAEAALAAKRKAYKAKAKHK